MARAAEPPDHVHFELEEALQLLGVLEDVRDELLTGRMLGLLLEVMGQIAAMTRKLGFDDGGAR